MGAEMEQALRADLAEMNSRAMEARERADELEADNDSLRDVLRNLLDALDAHDQDVEARHAVELNSRVSRWTTRAEEVLRNGPPQAPCSACGQTPSDGTPCGCFTTSLRQAYEAGVQARRDHVAGSLAGPYPEGSPEAQEFFRGWVITNAREAGGGAV